MRAFKILFGLALLVVTGGTFLAIAQPENTLASPFKGIAIPVVTTAREGIRLVKDMGRVSSADERKMVVAALDIMMIMEHVTKVGPVSVPTDDMGSFPSGEHHLYPKYLAAKFSEFKDTISRDGTVEAYARSMDPLLVSIEELLNRLRAGE